MTTCRLKTIVKRIEGASESSPVAIFETDFRGIYDCIFAKTIVATQRVKSDQQFIGIYYGAAGVDDMMLKIGVEHHRG